MVGPTWVPPATIADVVFDASGPPPGTGGEARRPLLGELLIQAKVVSAEQLAQALSMQAEPVNDKKIGQLLIERGWITEAQLTQTLSLQLSVPWVSLYHIDFSRQLLNRVQRELAERYCLIPIFVRHVKGQGETLYVAMDDPTNDIALAEVSRQASLPARPMIASATDIRSAIRVYYGEPTGPGGQIIDVPAPPTRAEPPTTTREGQQRREVSPPTPPVPTTPDPHPPHSQPTRAPSHPPGAPPAPPAPPAARRPQRPAPPTAAAGDEGDAAPPTTRSYPPPGGRAAALAAAAIAGDGTPSPPRAAEEAPVAVPRAEGSEPRRMRGKMLSLTLLDGTTIALPAKKSAAAQEGLTARDFVSALRATAHGADATEILGETPRWEPVVAALLSLLLRKGLIADWEFIEELRKI
jgi:type IV pilus assembly protein PilB